MKKILFLVVIIGAVLTGCSKSDDDVLKEIGLQGMSSKEILNALANDTVDSSTFSVSVTDSYLTLKTDDSAIQLDMPVDEYYLSIAPYVNFTHECMMHSATGCTGELGNKEFHIYYEDTDGNIIIDEIHQSMHNGFIDLWLPRDIEGTMTITYGDLEVEKMISTTSGNNTCETTMQLT